MTHYVLFSGGYDSLAATHWCMERGSTDVVLHLDTNTGIPENFDFVESVCDDFGWPLRVEEAPMTLYEFAVEYGFPGPAAHSWAYRYFKERQLRRVATDDDEMPHYWTGVRKYESQRRLKTVTDAIDGRERWVWLAPLMDWMDENVADYMMDHGLPENPVVEAIHRSGECYCGAFGSRDEELVFLQSEFPDHYEWLMDVERCVQEVIGTDEEWCYWGHGGESSEDLQRLMDQYDELDMPLCQSCSPEYVDASAW